MIYLLEKEVKAQRICMDDYFQNIFLPKYLVVRRTTKFLVVPTFFCRRGHTNFAALRTVAYLKTNM